MSYDCFNNLSVISEIFKFRIIRFGKIIVMHQLG